MRRLSPCWAHGDVCNSVKLPQKNTQKPKNQYSLMLFIDSKSKSLGTKVLIHFWALFFEGLVVGLCGTLRFDCEVTCGLSKLMRFLAELFLSGVGRSGAFSVFTASDSNTFLSVRLKRFGSAAFLSSIATGNRHLIYGILFECLGARCNFCDKCGMRQPTKAHLQCYPKGYVVVVEGYLTQIQVTVMVDQTLPVELDLLIVRDLLFNID
ncbi:Alo1 D-Arabinono-1,4-lactone oxidase [Striga asiatica]|uniref:Alo1 D-Arabinono-1,4-lactone oxidase n=1 Tax=Striga asiatica TaxID=4170 RepID=A0A5A7QWL7_STRAF|nr:Alo1 D-Arabinono-1,4-lactone oxidase [Striga asiatica]